jgi:hypothetical protein
MGDTKDSKGIPWLSTGLAVLAAAGTALGAWGTYQSNQNKGRIDDLTAQIQATQQFAAGIHDARNVLTSDQQGQAMVELSRLYALARTPQQKLVLIQIAQMSRKWQGLEAMAILIGNDEQMQPSQSEANRKVRASIDRIIANAKTEIDNEAAAKRTPAPTPTPKRTGGRHDTAEFPQPHPLAAAAQYGDAPLTQSTDAATAASAALIAALPKTVKQHGWIFLGDAAGEDANAKGPDAAILSRSATTSAHAVPHPGASITACHDINLRDAPPHGKVVSIVPQGTTVQVRAPDSPATIAFSTTSAVTGRRITARWAFVEVEATTTEGSPAGCP